MRIPEVAAELRTLANKHSLPRLEYLADELSRRKSGPRAPKTSNTVTPVLYSQIRAYRAANPLASQVQIAEHFGVNQGRVSEALHGKRT